MQFATDYNNGITYAMNALLMRVGSGRVQKRVTRGQLCRTVEAMNHIDSKLYRPSSSTNR